MTHHITSFMRSVQSMRQFADEHQIENIALTITCDTEREYAQLVGEITKYFGTYLLFSAYTDDRSRPWYENFMFWGVDVTLTYKGKPDGPRT